MQFFVFFFTPRAKLSMDSMSTLQLAGQTPSLGSQMTSLLIVMIFNALFV